MSSVESMIRKEQRWLLRKNKNGNQLSLTKMISGRPITVKLIKNGSNKFRLEFPSYLFSSKISHFAPVQDEYRFCRNKSILFSLIKNLKKSSVWGMIDNKEFLKINFDNDRSNKAKLDDELQEILG